MVKKSWFNAPNIVCKHEVDRYKCYIVSKGNNVPFENFSGTYDQVLVGLASIGTTDAFSVIPSLDHRLHFQEIDNGTTLKCTVTPVK